MTTGPDNISLDLGALHAAYDGGDLTPTKVVDLVLRRIADQVFIPFTVGGGIRTTEDVRLMLESGADKVAINTAAVENPEFVAEASAKFGAQCIVVAIDAKSKDGDWEIYIHGGRDRANLNAIITFPTHISSTVICFIGFFV